MNAPASVTDQLRAATDLAHAGRFPQAEAMARQVLALQPRSAAAHYVLALSAMLQKRHADALPPIDAAIGLEAGNAQYHFVRAMCLAGAGRADEAVAAYRSALSIRPSFFEAWANLGNVLEMKRSHAQAEEAYRHALRLKPGAPPVLHGLGVCLFARGALEEAAKAFTAAVAGNPNMAAFRTNLGKTLGRLGRPDAAIVHLRESVRLRPRSVEAWVNLSEQCYLAGQQAEAIAAIDQAIALDAGNTGLKYFRNSISGAGAERWSDADIRDWFDRFAPTFDDLLVKDLEYRTPQRMGGFLAPWLSGREGKLRIEDLGCGTGLSGLVLKPYAAHLSGVDLSGEMVAKARDRGVYDSLTVAEIVAYLGDRPPEACDLVAAMDVFVYIRSLEPVFQAATRSLAPGGLFAFSVERLDSEGDIAVNRSGRYAHSRKYLRSLAAANGLVEWRMEDTVLRKEVGQPVEGLLAAFSKP